MAVVKTNIGTNDDGTARIHYACDGHAVITGPLDGHVTLDDGTVYDVTDHVIEAASAEHAAEVADKIGRRFAAEGHPHHRDGQPFVHTPSED